MQRQHAGSKHARREAARAAGGHTFVCWGHEKYSLQGVVRGGKTDDVAWSKPARAHKGHIEVRRACALDKVRAGEAAELRGERDAAH